MVRTSIEAAIQELQSIGIFSGILTTASMTLKEIGFNGPIAMFIMYVITIIGNIFWQVKHDEREEIHTVPKQMSRLGVNLGMWSLAMTGYIALLKMNGIEGSQLDSYTSLSPMWNLVFSYVTNFIMYSMSRGVLNLLLLIPAISNYIGNIGD